MKRLAIHFALLLMASSCFGLNTLELITNTDAQEILNRKCIRLGTSEILPIKFETACQVMSNPNLVVAAQEEFARSISRNGKVDFPVIQTQPGYFHYFNENGKRTDIIELYKMKTDEISFDYIVLASGKRGFGRFDVIVHLQVIDMHQSGIVYSVNVHAWPHSWLARTSHKVGLTRHYFKKKMRTISWVAREVGTGLCQREEQKQLLKNVDATPSSHLSKPSVH